MSNIAIHLRRIDNNTRPTQPPKPRTASLPDIRIDYQNLRHTRMARGLRAALYRMIIGREGWPLVFRAPQTEDDIPRGTSPNLYVHLPFCSQICPHCPYTKTLYKPALQARYGLALSREIRSYLRRSDIPPVESLYFGGGTPSVTPDLIRETIEPVKPSMISGAEIGVEVHPTHANPSMLSTLREMGVTRVSLGIETFRPDLLKMLARGYSPDEAEAAIVSARAAGFECVDVNLLFSIPGQEINETADDAKRCLGLGVDQLSAYQLFTFVHTPFGKRVRHGDFAIYGDRARLRAQKLFNQACLDAGLKRSSPWNFTRPGISPYSTVTHEDYVGFGAGAGSKVGGVFWFNTFSVTAYMEAKEPRPALVLQTAEKFRRAHWLYWRLYRMAVDPAEYRQLFARDLYRDYDPWFKLMRLLGMGRLDGDIWRVTEFGSVWMHRIQQLFSITYIDSLWDKARTEPWPQEVVLT